MALRNAIIGSQVPLGLVPEILDPVDMVPLGREFFLVIDAVVVEFRDIENVVRSIAIGVDNAVGFDPLSDNTHQGQ